MDYFLFWIAGLSLGLFCGWHMNAYLRRTKPGQMNPDLGVAGAIPYSPTTVTPSRHGQYDEAFFRVRP